MKKTCTFYLYHQEEPVNIWTNLALRAFKQKTPFAIKLQTDEELMVLDKALWTFSKSVFLPHGTYHNASDRHPCLLITDFQQLTKSRELVLISPSSQEDFTAATLLGLDVWCCFDNQETLQRARQCWQIAKKSFLYVSFLVWQHMQWQERVSS